jgi:DnaJ-class molecular chaperone
MNLEENLYSIFGLEPHASLDEITERYRILAREYHPDLNPTHHDIGLFIKLRRAYEVLKNKKSREAYDKTIGIYHSKENASVFLKETSHRILRDKLEGLEDFDEEDDLNNYIPEHSTRTNKEGFLSKISNLFQKKKIENKVDLFEKVKLEQTKPLRKRSFQFSINILESILGTERIIVLDEINGEQKSIKVKIPKGIIEKSILNVFHPKRGSFPVRILFMEHEYLTRKNLDVTILLPFSEEELKFAQTCELYTCKGKVKITIPKNLKSPLRIKDHGISNEEKNTIGDFFVQIKNGGSKAPVERIRVLKLLEPLHI